MSVATETDMYPRFNEFLASLPLAARKGVEAFAYFLPKVDLHCHLNGSISTRLLRYLELQLEVESRETSGEPPEKKRILEDLSKCNPIGQQGDAVTGAADNPKERMLRCFATFDEVYRIITNIAFTRLAVQDLLLHSAAEHVCAIEIRSSRRDGMRRTWRGADTTTAKSKEYFEAIIETVECLKKGGYVDFNTGELRAKVVEKDNTWWCTFQYLYWPIIQQYNEYECNTESSCSCSSKDFDSTMSLTRQALHRFQRSISRMHIRFCISVNRGASVEAAQTSIDIAGRLVLKQREAADKALLCPLTSIDFSGNCYKNQFDDFHAVLREARDRHGLFVTLHAGEKEDAGELREMIKFGPDRWGHLVFTDPENRERLEDSRAPVELCLTSNIITCGHEDVTKHHLKHFVRGDRRGLTLCLDQLRFFEAAGQVPFPFSIPFSINTDDRGVFENTLTNELLLLLQHPDIFGGTTVDVSQQCMALWAVVRASLYHMFPPVHIIEERGAKLSDSEALLRAFDHYYELL